MEYYEITKAFLTNGGYHNNNDCMIGEIENYITENIYYFYYSVENQWLALFKGEDFEEDFKNFTSEIFKCYHEDENDEGFERLFKKEIKLEDKPRYKEANKFDQAQQREEFKRVKDILTMKIETIYNVLQSKNFGKYDYQ